MKSRRLCPNYGCTPSVIRMTLGLGSGGTSPSYNTLSRSTERTTTLGLRESWLSETTDGRWLGFSSGALSSTPTADHKYVSKEWLREHIQQGPLGECYPDVMYGMEGDTPSYLACIPVGPLPEIVLITRLDCPTRSDPTLAGGVADTSRYLTRKQITTTIRLMRCLVKWTGLFR